MQSKIHKAIKALIESYREQHKKASVLNDAIIDYTWFDGDWFSIYSKVYWDMLDVLIWEDFSSNVIDFALTRRYYILDRDRAEKEWKTFIKESEFEEYKVKIITDDDEFILHIMDVAWL